ncbi:helix-turn-helix domain-containing protein [Paraburkholderia fungorum]|uniref:helix-turn-helix domain-containing protein n=1 Tax=Paraburkholderia fungorum TaxID=134537 RepID=UPI000DB2FEC9|nr:helix-turn-helix domain-containing protein [Paraburkholderia fungorum]PZR44265.1 MAG: hypothetical protein DI523_24695 [Paraburkholderia fungorum]
MSSNSGLKPIAAKRLQAAKLLERGWPVESVAETVGMNVRTVKDYKAMLDAGGIEKIERISVGGRKSALDDKARAWIVKTVKGSPRLHGFETDRWSNPKLLTVIEREFGLRFSDVYIRKLTIDLGLLDRMQPHKAPTRQPYGSLPGNRALMLTIGRMGVSERPSRRSSVCATRVSISGISQQDWACRTC